MTQRICEWCKEPLGIHTRADAKTCSRRCRQAKARFRVGVAGGSSQARRASFAYADPLPNGHARPV